MYHAIQQGLLYAVDCIDLVVYHLPSSTRTVNHSFIILINRYVRLLKESLL